MQKLIVALSAVVITGLAGFSVAGGDAQEARIVRPKVERVEIEEVESEDHAIYVLDEREVYTQAFQGFPSFAVAGTQGQAGTWQIVTLDKMAILLNTATGETFTLDKGEEGLMWKPIARPAPQPRMYKAAAPRDMPATPDIDEKLEKLRKELRSAKGDARERIEHAIEELERARENARRARTPQPRKDADRAPQPRKDADRAEKREEEKDDIENQLRDIEESIEDLKERFEESDSVKEREKIEKALKDLKAKAEALRKEHRSR